MFKQCFIVSHLLPPEQTNCVYTRSVMFHVVLCDVLSEVLGTVLGMVLCKVLGMAFSVVLYSVWFL